MAGGQPHFQMGYRKLLSLLLLFPRNHFCLCCGLCVCYCWEPVRPGSWWEEPGEYRWLFSPRDGNVLIHILWFKDVANWSDEKGQTVLKMECDLLAFAK